MCADSRHSESEGENRERQPALVPTARVEINCRRFMWTILCEYGKSFVEVNFRCSGSVREPAALAGHMVTDKKMRQSENCRAGRTVSVTYLLSFYCRAAARS